MPGVVDGLARDADRLALGRGVERDRGDRASLPEVGGDEVLTELGQDAVEGVGGSRVVRERIADACPQFLTRTLHCLDRVLFLPTGKVKM